MQIASLIKKGRSSEEIFKNLVVSKKNHGLSSGKYQEKTGSEN
jgi:hypothetical protein